MNDDLQEKLMYLPFLNHWH